MGFEDDYNPSGTVTQVNRYALGARGIDRIARTESGNTTLAYPMYDGHGNMRALLTRDGAGYDTGNWKTYDVWGSVRSGGSSSDPKQGYVASIGHVSDDESSLIYMRARYYEPATGRFISEDPARDWINWFVYCGNDPIGNNDPDGRKMNPVLAGGAVAWAVYMLFSFHQGDSDDMARSFRYFVATVSMALQIAVSQRIESWVMEVAKKVAAILRLDKMQRPDQIQYRWTRNDARIAFYTGYAIFLTFEMYDLEAWANGDFE